jgi:predicted nucleic acid-binding protein
MATALSLGISVQVLNETVAYVKNWARSHKRWNNGMVEKWNIGYEIR